MPQMKLIGGTDASPVVRLGRPEIDSRGLQRHPVVVALPDRDLAWGIAKMHRRWDVPIVEVETPTHEAGVAVQRTVAALMKQAEEIIRKERQEADVRYKLRQEIADAERKIEAAQRLIDANRESLSRLDQTNHWE
jgi:hypothetical protein